MDMVENIIDMNIRKTLRQTRNVDETISILQKVAEYENYKFALRNTRLWIKEIDLINCLTKFMRLSQELMDL